MILHQHETLVALILLALAACGGAPTQETAAETAAVQEAVGDSEIEAAIDRHLSKRTDLDFSAMTVDVTSVEYQGDEATAQVVFRSAENNQAMLEMAYELARMNGQWEVQSAGTGAAGQPSQDLPPGHPPVGGDSADQNLPPGHPPVTQ